MSLVRRATSAISRVFSAPVQMVKAAPYIWNYAGDNPLWHMINYLSYVRDGFNRNPLIYAAIMYKVRAAAATRPRVWIGDEDNADPAPRKHPLVKVLNRPNEHQSWTEFEGLNLLYLNLSGNCYILVDRERPGATPRAMYPLRPDRMWVKPGEKGITGYLYIPPGKTKTDGIYFLPEEVIHIKLPNAEDELEGQGYGQPPLAAAGQMVDVDNNITRYIKLFMERGTILSGLLKFNIPLDERIIPEMKRRWMDSYSGERHWGEIGVLDQGADYKQIGTTFKDMEFSSLDERSETRTLMVLGVPGILLNTRSGMANSTYSNITEARRVFWEDTMTGELALFDEEYDYVLTGNDEKTFIRRDYSRVPALQKNVPELIKAAKEAWTMGVPANDAFKIVGLQISDIPNGDISFIPSSAVISGSTPAGTLPQGRSGKKRPVLPELKSMTDDYCVLAPLPNQEQIKIAQDMIQGILGNDGINWVKPDTFHLTLCYGSGSRDQVMQVNLSEEIFSIVIESAGVFDTPDGYAIHLVVRQTDSLIMYQRKIQQQMIDAGLTLSEYTMTYQPHITLAYSSRPLTPFKITPFPLAIRQVEITDSDHQAIMTIRLKSVMPDNSITVPATTTERKNQWSDEKKATIWKAVDDIARNYEQVFGDDTAQAFEKDRRGILAMVNEFGKESRSRKAPLIWLDMIPRLELFMTGKSPDNWRTSFNSMGALLTDTGNYWGAELGFTFNVRNLLGESWFQNYQLTFSQPIGKTTSDALHGMLALAQEEGWSIQEMTDRMDLLFQQWKNGDLTPEDFDWLKQRMPPYRRELIARTETTRLQNAGSVQLFKDWNVTKKEWLSTSDSRTRPSHAAANRQVVDIDNPFEVGGFRMMHPGDSSMGAPVREIADCRCATLPVIE